MALLLQKQSKSQNPSRWETILHWQGDRAANENNGKRAGTEQGGDWRNAVLENEVEEGRHVGGQRRGGQLVSCPFSRQFFII